MRYTSNPHLPPDYPMEPMEMATWAEPMPRKRVPLRQWVVAYELALCAVVAFSLGFVVAFAYGQGGL